MSTVDPSNDDIIYVAMALNFTRVLIESEFLQMYSIRLMKQHYMVEVHSSDNTFIFTKKVQEKVLKSTDGGVSFALIFPTGYTFIV